MVYFFKARTQCLNCDRSCFLMRNNEVVDSNVPTTMQWLIMLNHNLEMAGTHSGHLLLTFKTSFENCWESVGLFLRLFLSRQATQSTLYTCDANYWLASL